MRREGFGLVGEVFWSVASGLDGASVRKVFFWIGVYILRRTKVKRTFRHQFVDYKGTTALGNRVSSSGEENELICHKYLREPIPSQPPISSFPEKLPTLPLTSPKEHTSSAHTHPQQCRNYDSKQPYLPTFLYTPSKQKHTRANNAPPPSRATTLTRPNLPLPLAHPHADNHPAASLLPVRDEPAAVHGADGGAGLLSGSGARLAEREGGYGGGVDGGGVLGWWGGLWVCYISIFSSNPLHPSHPSFPPKKSTKTNPSPPFFQNPPPPPPHRPLKTNPRLRSNPPPNPPAPHLSIHPHSPYKLALVGIAVRERGYNGRGRGVVLSVEGAETDCFWWWGW